MGKKAADMEQVSRDFRLGKGNECDYKENHGDTIEQNMNLDANQIVSIYRSASKLQYVKGSVHDSLIWVTS